jgi:hypothetical protein
MGLTNIDNVFAKINLKCKTKKIDYDTYIVAPMHFNDPCNLSKLSLSFYAPDGTLYDFNGIDSIVNLKKQLLESALSYID